MTADEQTIESLQQQLLEAQESSRHMLLRAQGAEAERDALAAHVERMREVWQRLHLRSPVHVEVLKAYSYVMRDTPATSLARFRAQWAAEGAQAAAEAIRMDYEGPMHAEDIADFAEQVADDYRRQAAEAP